MNPVSRIARGLHSPGAAVGLLAAATAAIAAVSGCTPTSGAVAHSATATAPATSVDLSAAQAGELQIAAANIFRFPREKTELGSVAFAEDPAIVQAESALLGAAATLELTRKELRRAHLLYATEGVSAREVEQATSDSQTAAAALAAARAALHALGKSDTQIDGMIATGHIDAPARKRAASQWVEANVFEADMPLVHPGQEVQVAVAAYPTETFAGHVYLIYATVDPSLHRQTVRCDVADPKHELRPGMLATITIELGPPVQALAIPADGVVREGDGTLTAWVTTDQRHFTQRIIRTGLREDGEVQIVDGLRPAEQVVTRGAIYLDNMINAAPSD